MLLFSPGKTSLWGANNLEKDLRANCNLLHMLYPLNTFFFAYPHHLGAPVCSPVAFQCSAGGRTGCLFSVNVLMWQPGGSWTIKGTEGQRGQKPHVTLGNSRTKGHLLPSRCDRAYRKEHKVTGATTHQYRLEG